MIVFLSTYERTKKMAQLCGPKTQVGDIVIFKAENGTDADITHANRFLQVGKVYEVSEVQVLTFFTYLRVEGNTGMFNSVLFEQQ